MREGWRADEKFVAWLKKRGYARLARRRDSYMRVSDGGKLPVDTFALIFYVSSDTVEHMWQAWKGAREEQPHAEESRD